MVDNGRPSNVEEVPLFARLHRHGSQNDIEKANFDKLLSSPTNYFNNDNQMFGDPLNNNTETEQTQTQTQTILFDKKKKDTNELCRKQIEIHMCYVQITKTCYRIVSGDLY